MSWSRIAIGTFATGSNTNGTPLTVNYPASGIVAGDILLYFGCDSNSGQTLTWSNTPTQLVFSSSNHGRGIWAAIAAGTENGGSVTVASSSTGRVQAGILVYRGGLQTLGSLLNTSSTLGGSANTGLDWPTITPTVPNCLVLFYGGKSNSNVTGYSAGPATEILDQTSGTILSSVIEESIQTTATTITTGTWTIAGDSSSTRRAFAIALVPAAASTAGALANGPLIKRLVGGGLVN